MFCIQKQDNVAHDIEKIPGCSENQFSEKALLQFIVYKVLLFTE